MLTSLKGIDLQSYNILLNLSNISDLISSASCGLNTDSGYIFLFLKQMTLLK